MSITNTPYPAAIEITAHAKLQMPQSGLNQSITPIVTAAKKVAAFLDMATKLALEKDDISLTDPTP